MHAALRTSLGALSAALLASTPARAAPRPCAAKGPYVVITAPHPAPANVDLSAVIERLQQELAGRGLELCAGAPPAPAAPALATVRLEPVAPARDVVALDIEVRDAVTAKRVGREVDLATTPDDGRAVVVALAADELLRASWAELSLERAPKPAVEMTPAVRAALDPRPSPRRPRFELGLRGVAAWSTGGLSLFGGDVVVAAPIAARWSAVLSGGGRASPGVRGPDGVASARGAAFGLAARLAVLAPPRGPALDWALGPAVDVLELHGEASPGARASSRLGVALRVETGPALRIPLGEAGPSLALGASIGVVAHGVALLDGGATLAAGSGVSGQGFAGIEVP